MLSSHLPLLQVVIPLLAAPVCVILHNKTLGWCLATVVSLVSFIIACTLFGQAASGESVTYAIGGWAAPAGIEYHLDRLTAFLLVIITGLAAFILIGARENLENEIAADRLYLFYTAFLLNLTGLLGVIMTGDAFNVFVFIEIASLSSYAMISISKDRRSLYAAYKYLILGTIGASFILISIGLLYGLTGTLNIYDLHDRLADLENKRTLATALVFFTIGIGLKAAIWPLHLWLPDAYTYSPSIVSTFLAGTSTKVFIYVLVRFIYSLFGIEFSFGVAGLQYLLMLMAVVGILYGSIQAIRQDSIKRLLAFSSIAQIGYMVLGISLATAAGLAAGLIHVFNHAIIKATLFLCVANIIYYTGTDSLKQLGGIGKKMPFTMGLMVIAGLSIIGVPLTAGFISKWFLIQSAMANGYWLLIGLVVFSSILAVVYTWKILETAYFSDAAEAGPVIQDKPVPYSMYATLIIFTGACVYFGLQTDVSVGMATATAESLAGIRP
ncbi:MAG: monovalent cation/H+ antiporter subunit D family protein [Gammaproteobacteria bacterium]